MFSIILQFFSKIFLIFITLMLPYIIYRIKHRHFYKKLNQIPGPMPLPILGNILAIEKDKTKLVSQLKAYKQKYGHPFAFWLGEIFASVMISKPEHIQKVNNALGALSHGPLLQVLSKGWFGDGLLMTSDKEKWRRHRKVISTTFTPKILESFVPIFYEKAIIMTDLLQNELENCDKGNFFEMWDYMKRATFDSICNTAMGVQLNSQTEKCEYLDASDSQLEVMMDRLRYSWLLSENIYKFSSLFVKETQNLKIIHQFADKIIDDKIKSFKELKNDEIDEHIKQGIGYGRNAQRKAFLDFLLEIIHNDPQWSKDEIKDELHFFTTAGYETSATTNCFTLLNLSFHQDIQEKVYDELVHILNKKRVPTVEDLSKMIYLEMVIKETMRKFPILPLQMKLLDEDITLDNYVIPKGAYVVNDFYNLHNDPNIWENPDKFDPDRFLPENFSKKHPYSYLPFGGGLRMCLGYKYAMLQMKMFLAVLLSNYKFTTSIKEEELQLKIEMTMKSVNGFLFNIQKRNDNYHLSK